MLINMRKKLKIAYCLSTRGQTAIEYMLVLATVVIVVLVGMQIYGRRIYTASETYYNSVGNMILDGPPRCGNGKCEVPWENYRKCCADCDLANQDGDSCEWPPPPGP